MPLSSARAAVKPVFQCTYRQLHPKTGSLWNRNLFPRCWVRRRVLRADDVPGVGGVKTCERTLDGKTAQTVQHVAAVLVGCHLVGRVGGEEVLDVVETVLRPVEARVGAARTTWMGVIARAMMTNFCKDAKLER